MPVFPLVGSITTPPFLSLPSASAVRSMESATRSFALPAGFCRSIWRVPVRFPYLRPINPCLGRFSELYS